MKKIISLISLLILSGCSTELKYTMNNSKFLTPEARGKLFKGDVSLSYQTVNKVVISEAFDPIIFNLPASATDVNQIRNGGNISLPINLGLMEQLDFYTIDSKYGFKYQFVGAGDEKREEGYKAAVALAYGYDHPDKEDVIYSNGNSVRTYSTDMKVKSYELSLLFGKRIDNKNLFYTNLFHDRYEYDGKLTSTSFSEVKASGKSQNTGLLLGYELSSDPKGLGAKIKLEGGIVYGKLDDSDDRTAGTFGSSLGFSW